MKKLLSLMVICFTLSINLIAQAPAEKPKDVCDLEPVMKSFSPNGDGKNDFFVIGNLEAFKNPAIWIYNRWGKLLYSSDNYQNNWDGEENPDGTYFFVLLLNDPEKEYKGTVFITR
jgi:gliding motility-associated-like protein